MKRLILIRHAKSAWDDPLVPDHERPLNDRGRAAATDLGQWLASRGDLPGKVLVSDALRTRQTWDGIAPAMGSDAVVELKSALYLAGVDVMLAVLKKAQADVVMMIGHNPGIGELAGKLVATAPLNSDFGRYPTGATLVVDFNVESWDEIELGKGAVVDFMIPKELVA